MRVKKLFEDKAEFEKKVEELKKKYANHSLEELKKEAIRITGDLDVRKMNIEINLIHKIAYALLKKIKGENKKLFEGRYPDRESVKHLKQYFDFHITKFGSHKTGEFYVRKPGFKFPGWHGQVEDMGDLRNKGLNALEDWLERENQK
jgi:hypothetical protein